MYFCTKIKVYKLKFRTICDVISECYYACVPSRSPWCQAVRM